MILNKYFDRIICATIPSRKKSFEQVQKQVEQFGGTIVPFKIKPLGCKENEEYDYVDEPMPVEWGGRNAQSYNYMKCFFKIIKQAKTDGIKSLLYLEDDVYIFPHIEQFLPVMMDNLPKDWHMMHFNPGNLCFIPNQKHPIYHFVAPFIYRCYSNVGFHMVAISEKMYDYILELESKDWLKENPYIDMVTMHQFHFGYSPHGRLPCYAAYPYLACEKPGWSNNEGKYVVREEFEVWAKYVHEDIKC